MSVYDKTVILEENEKGFSVNGNKVFGICRIKSENDTCLTSFSAINLAVKTEGDYYFFCLSEKEVLFKKLSVPSLVAEISKKPSVDDRFFLLYKQDESVYVVCKGVGDELTDDEFSALKKSLLKETEEMTGFFYDDEQIAEEDYFLKDGDEDKKNERALYKRTLPSYDQSEVKKEEQAEKDEISCDEKIIPSFDEKRPFYLTVADELSYLFSAYEREDSLKSSIPSGDFVKINYDGGFYVVGTVKEKGAVKYICYGIPAPYSDSPPDALKDVSTFIPISVFDMKGDGYFMIFQDAITGECKKTAK